jgi:Ca2+:H+ antiporter
MFVPLAIALRVFAPDRQVGIFLTSALAIVPLAAYIGGATEELADRLGVVIVAFVGNAAEHYSAVVMAAQNEMDAAIAISVGSSNQIALFVAPVLVFSSYLIAPQPMDLLFTTFELVAIAVLSIAFIAHDGETNWMEGIQLLAVYVILSLGFFFLPAP